VFFAVATLPCKVNELLLLHLRPLERKTTIKEEALVKSVSLEARTLRLLEVINLMNYPAEALRSPHEN